MTIAPTYECGSGGGRGGPTHCVMPCNVLHSDTTLDLLTLVLLHTSHHLSWEILYQNICCHGAVHGHMVQSGMCPYVSQLLWPREIEAI